MSSKSTPRAAKFKADLKSTTQAKDTTTSTEKHIKHATNPTEKADKAVKRVSKKTSDGELQTDVNTMKDASHSNSSRNNDEDYNNNTSSAPVRTLKRAEVWLDIQVPPFDLGRVVIELFPDCPLAYENFRSLCTGEVTDPCTKEKLTYAGSLIDQINDDYIVMGEICDDADERDGIELIADDKEGDENDANSLKDMAKEVLPQSKFSNLDNKKLSVEELKEKYAALKKQSLHSKTAITVNDKKINIVHDIKKPAVSIYGGFFPDEKPGLERQHIKPGTVSMFCEKTNRNGSKFLITLKPHMKWLDGQYTVIGHVTSGLRALYSLKEYSETGETCVISDCGRLRKGMDANKKTNPFLSQAQELINQTDGVSVKPEEKQEEVAKKPVKCPDCYAKGKYVCRQLGKGVKYHCSNLKCKKTFWIQDTKYDETIVSKALELKKSQKIALHEQHLLQTSRKFRQELHKKEKEERLAKKSEKEAQAATEAKGKKGKKDKKDAAQQPSSVVQASKPIKPVSKFASPQLATVAQKFLEQVVVHQQLKQANSEAAKDDHKKFEYNKRLERGEIDEEGNELLPNGKRKFNGDYDDDDDYYGDDSRHQNKRGRGNFSPPQRDHKDSSMNDEAPLLDDNTKALREIAKNPNSKEFKELVTSLEKMDQSSRREIRKQLGLPPGPSQTPRTNTNKRDFNIDRRIVRSVANGRTRLEDAKVMVSSGASATTKKKKDKTRWRNREESKLPDGFIVREKRTKNVD